MRSVKRIVRIQKIKGYKIAALFNTGESRLIDFEKLFSQWNIKKGDLEYPLKTSLEEFQKVEVRDGTLVWRNISVKSTDEYNNPVRHFYDVDPIVLYAVSEIEPLKKVETDRKAIQTTKELYG